LTMQLVLDLVWHLVLSLLDQKLLDTWDWNHIMLVGEVSSPSFLQLWIGNIFWFWNIIKWTRRLLSKSNTCPNWFRLNVVSAVYSTLCTECQGLRPTAVMTHRFKAFLKWHCTTMSMVFVIKSRLSAFWQPWHSSTIQSLKFFYIIPQPSVLGCWELGHSSWSLFTINILRRNEVVGGSSFCRNSKVIFISKEINL
jgi:hypothetical protein